MPNPTAKPVPNRSAASELSRNPVLQHSPAGLSSVPTAAGPVTGWSASAELPSADLSPQEALDQLYLGNKRFLSGNPLAPNRDVDRLKEIAPRQRPFAAFLGCADSRVPIEIVFDQGFGDLFVTRIAGNVTTPECIGSLEFGTQILEAKVLYVLGHTNCGAVTAAMKGEPVPGQISTLFQHLRPAVRHAQGNLDTAIRENVRHHAAILREASPIIAKLVKEGRLIVAGGVYDLETGAVTGVEV